MTWRQHALSALLLLLTLACLYGSHVRSAPFVYEDTSLTDNLQRPPDWQHLPRGRGLTYESWTIVRTPLASHALNVGLHLAVVLFSGTLIGHLTGSVFAGWAVAGIVALHPLTVESVAYAASRGELMAAVGVWLLLLCVAAPAMWTWAVVPPALALAYLGKETGLVGVALIPLVVWMQGDRRWAGRLALVLASAGVGLALVRWPALQALSHLGENGPYAISPGIWIATQTAAVSRLVVLSVAPFWLSVSPDVAPLQGSVMVAALILAAALLEVVWRVSVAAPLAAFGIMGCLIVVAPRFVVRTPGSPFNEHQWYLALPFVACVLVAGIQAMANAYQRERPCPA